MEYNVKELKKVLTEKFECDNINELSKRSGWVTHKQQKKNKKVLDKDKGFW